MKIHFSAASDKGRVRQTNEDSWLADLALGIFAIADGMGGHAAGEVASRMAVEVLHEFLAQSAKEGGSSSLEHAFQAANTSIYRASREKSECQGMGTTLVAVVVAPPSPVVANVGDSRLYQLRGETIEQITEDHSLVWEYYKKGQVSKERLPQLPLKSIVTRALGISPVLEIDLQELTVLPGDILLLCSDGLSDLVRDEEMLHSVLGASGDLNRAGQNLIRLANEKGGKDNITVVLVKMEGGGGSLQ